MWLSTLAPSADEPILRFVRPTFTRTIVAVASLIAGVFIGSIHWRAQQPSPTQTNSPVVSAESHAIPVETVEGYPEELRLAPQQIFYFLQQHPKANVQRLWQRLGITTDSTTRFDPDDICDCEVNIFQYNLDDDVESEKVLQIKRTLAESYRYLIFKGSEIEPKFLGHIDVYAKYTPADPVVFLSNGRAWLVVQQTAATGSGLAAWADTVYEVVDGRVRPVASYLARVRQSGDWATPTKEFVGLPVSCQIERGHAVLTVAYTLKYTEHSSPDVPRFISRKKAVLIGSLEDGSTTVDAAHSEISPREFETIYNFN
jgi:hypothetical protein